MPGPRTYQAIGFTAYHGRHLLLRHRKADLRRHAAIGGGTTLALLAITGAALVVARQRSRMPTV